MSDTIVSEVRARKLHGIRAPRVSVSSCNGIDGSKLVTVIIGQGDRLAWQKLEAERIRTLLRRAAAHLSNADATGTEDCLAEALGRVAMFNRKA